MDPGRVLYNERRYSRNYARNSTEFGAGKSRTYRRGYFDRILHFQLPIVEDELIKQNGEDTGKDEMLQQKFTKLVTADGTYATQSALTTQYKGKKEDEKKYAAVRRCCAILIMSIDRLPLRKLLMNGDFFLGAGVACTLTKLALRYADVTREKVRQNVRGSNGDDICAPLGFHVFFPPRKIMCR